MMEKVADMTAWLPTIEANVATTNTGQKTGPALKTTPFKDMSNEYHVSVCFYT